MDNIINVLIKEADKAYKKNEVPVSAVVVYKNKIIAKAYNSNHKKNDVTNHAEILAIKKAAKKLNDWRLNECDLYVTLEPCDMCMEVIKQSRINNVYYLIEKLDYKKGYNKTNKCMINLYDNIKVEKYKEKLSNFFKLKCKR